MIIEIAIVVLIIILLASSFFALRHAKKNKPHSPKQLAKTELVLTEDEKRLRALIEKKRSLMNELHNHFAGLAETFDKEGVKALKEKAKDIKKSIDNLLDMLEEQLDILDEMVKIDKNDLDYLKHILKKEVPSADERIHIKNFIKHIEDVLAKEEKKEDRKKIYDHDNHSIRQRIYNRILEETKDDAVKQGRMLLAFNFLYLHILFEKLVILVEGDGSGKNKFEGQRDIAKRMLKTADGMSKGKSKKSMNIPDVIKEAKDNDIPAINSRIASEIYELEHVVFPQTSNIRDLTEQLRQNEESKKIPKPPYLKVLNHPVEAVIDIEDMKRKAFGKGEEVSLGNMPEDLLIGADDNKCLIILGHGMPANHAAILRNGITCHLSAVKDSETKGIFIIRNNEIYVLCADSQDEERMKQLIKESDTEYDFIKKLLAKDTKASVKYKRKMLKLYPGDNIILAPGYEFEFST